MPNNIYFIEGLIYRIFGFSISLGLFIFWRRKNALRMYQAWALFHVAMNVLLFYHDIFNVLNPQSKLLVNVAFFINNLIVVWHSWKISEKYMPKEKIEKFNRETKPPKLRKAGKNLLARVMSFWITLKYGGNHEHSIRQIKADMSKSLHI